jgi:hypothetical protein
LQALTAHREIGRNKKTTQCTAERKSEREDLVVEISKQFVPCFFLQLDRLLLFANNSNNNSSKEEKREEILKNI